MSKKIMVICRGLPGSGKSSFANKLFMKFAGATSNRDRVKLCSADNFFMKVVGGEKRPSASGDGIVVHREYEYQFNPALLGQAHQKCWEDAFLACNNGVPMVIIDNTNSERWEYANYEHLAAIFGYAVTIQEVGIFESNGTIQNIVDKQRLQTYFERQTHDVPLSAFLAMWWRWEVDQRARPLTDQDTDPNTPVITMGLTVEELDGEG